MDCNTCKEYHRQAEPVSYIAYESMKATLERTIRRLWILALVLIVLLAGSNAAWIYYESQWEVVETYQDVWQEADGDGVNKFIGGDYFGWPTSENADPDSNP